MDEYPQIMDGLTTHKKTILITGGAGNVGSALARKLLQNVQKYHDLKKYFSYTKF